MDFSYKAYNSATYSYNNGKCLQFSGVITKLVKMYHFD